MHRSPVWSAVLSLGVACLVLAVPGQTSALNAEAAGLAVGALALLAGHRWALLVMLAAHTALAGRVLPLAADPLLPPAAGVAIGATLVALVPTIAWSLALLPHLIAELWPEGSARARMAGVVLTVIMVSATAAAPYFERDTATARAAATVIASR